MLQSMMRASVVSPPAPKSPDVRRQGFASVSSELHTRGERLECQEISTDDVPQNVRRLAFFS